jgi:replicative DNA helicase
VNPISKVNAKFKDAIREKAIKRSMTRIVIAQKSPEDFTEEQLEVIVQEEEQKIYSAIKEKGVLAVLAVLGIGIFG